MKENNKGNGKPVNNTEKQKSKSGSSKKQEFKIATNKVSHLKIHNSSGTINVSVKKDNETIDETRTSALIEIKEARKSIVESGIPLLSINEIRKEVEERRIGWQK